jgi:hypothetical protein
MWAGCIVSLTTLVKSSLKASGVVSQFRGVGFEIFVASYPQRCSLLAYLSRVGRSALLSEGNVTIRLNTLQ